MSTSRYNKLIDYLTQCAALVLVLFGSNKLVTVAQSDSCVCLMERNGRSHSGGRGHAWLLSHVSIIKTFTAEKLSVVKVKTPKLSKRKRQVYFQTRTRMWRLRTTWSCFVSTVEKKSGAAVKVEMMMDLLDILSECHKY